MAKKELRFTCQRAECGAVWYGPIKVKRPPNKLTLAGARMQASGARMSPIMGGHRRGGYAMQQQELEQRRTDWENRQRCPNCQSKKITAKKVKI